MIETTGTNRSVRSSTWADCKPGRDDDACRNRTPEPTPNGSAYLYGPLNAETCWPRAIAVREAVRVARRRPTTAELSEVPARGDPQLAGDLRDVLERLSPQHRAVLTLRDIEGLDESQTAALLAVPPGTVKSRLSRARLAFRKEWQR